MLKTRRPFFLLEVSFNDSRNSWSSRLLSHASANAGIRANKHHRSYPIRPQQQGYITIFQTQPRQDYHH
jgi:hypothetical protein